MSEGVGSSTSGGGGLRWPAFDSGEWTPLRVRTELQRRYASGERRFHRVDLSDADLAGVTLDGATFDESWFFDANFQGASLRGTSFRRCNVKCATSGGPT